MRRVWFLLAVVALLVSLSVVAREGKFLADHVRVSVMNEEPITLNGNDYHYVQHGVRQFLVDGEWPYKVLGYTSFRSYALDYALFELLVDGVELAPDRFSVFKDDEPSWHAGWYFYFPPNSFEARTYEFTGHWAMLQEDGSWFEMWRTREVTIEY